MAAAEPLRLAMNAVQYGLPEGGESEAYLTLRQQYRAALTQGFQEQDIEAYGIPMTRLEGRRAREQYLPYGPGRSFALALEAIARRREYQGTLSARYATLKSAGLLSETDELRMVQQNEEILTANARDIYLLTEGVLDRLPALSAGTPASFRRYNTLTLAAYNLWSVRHPARSAGAISGAQQSYQDAFVTSFGMGPMTPFTRTQALNQPGLDLVARLLEQILTEIRRQGGVNSRRGNVSGGSQPPLSGAPSNGLGGEAG
jgi:hypothetical protein